MKKISLCLICGNEDAHILRLLESAKDLIDELCMVRAIGTAEEDWTFIEARNWAIINAKSFKFAEYKNEIDGLPHVDHFGNARNMSFALATQHWQLWLDCDDVLTPETCQGIRAHAEDDRHDCYQFGYTKPDGSTCPRERLIRRGAGLWKSRIHETCIIASGDLGRDDSIVIEHNPTGIDRPAARARNLTLLQLALQDTPLTQEDKARLEFYYHSELFWLWEQDRTNENNRLDAVAAGNQAMMDLAVAKHDDRYKVLLQLAELQPALALRHLHYATEISPQRREAWALKSQKSLRENAVHHAAAWFTMMDALPKPFPPPWNHDRIWDKGEWGRDYLRVKIMRADPAQAEAAEIAHASNLKRPAYAAAVAEYEVGSTPASGVVFGASPETS